MSDYKGFIKDYATVYVDDQGQQRIMLPEAIDVPHLVRTVVVDEPGAPAVCVCSFMVNIVPKKSDALKGYGVKTSVK